MGQPVKLSDSLVLDARLSAELTDRSLASQIEFWAGLGRAIEPLLRLDKILVLKKSAKSLPLSECLKRVEQKKGRSALNEVLSRKAFPHYQPAPGRPGYLLRISEDGTKTVGSFVNRKFVSA